VTPEEQDQFAARLRTVQPARPPARLVANLMAELAQPQARPAATPPAEATPDIFNLLSRSLRWLVPATAILLGLLMIWHSEPEVVRHSSGANGRDWASTPPLTADTVKIDQQLVSSFDTVARLPSGEPVRFRCENWVDQVLVEDSNQGLLVVNSTPRFEVVPVGFESY